jgi:hypothetical protein
MANYYRIKEITGFATVVRQGSLLSLDLGDFFYPEELDTLAGDGAVVYFDDNTGEHFTWEPAAAPALKSAPVVPKAPAKQPEAPAEDADTK